MTLQRDEGKQQCEAEIVLRDGRNSYYGGVQCSRLTTDLVDTYWSEERFLCTQHRKLWQSGGTVHFMPKREST